MKSNAMIPAQWLRALLACGAVLTLLGSTLGCAPQTTYTRIEPKAVESFRTPYSGPKSALVVGNFDNRSDYARGLFASGGDQLGGQAKTVLKTHLQQTNRFQLLDRDSSDVAKQEAALLKKHQNTLGARYAVAGAVTEFGRKEEGDRQLFGIFGKSKKQIAYAKVQLNIIDVLSSEIVHSAQGAGEYVMSEREVLGFGSRAGYDATLNGKVLDLAVRDAVDRFVADIESGRIKLQ
jgi:curli biogenesis system outer membrane secretion channel CsgG